MALASGRHLAFPFAIGGDGRTAAPADDDAHVRDEVMQLLLTSTAERLFLPDFGGGVRKLVFEPASETLTGVVKARITNALTRWLGHRLTVEFIEVEFNTPETTLEVMVRYRRAGRQDSRVVKFQRTSR